MKKVIVAMSGGVDSSVAALLLKKQGFNVEGVFMHNWDEALNNDLLGNSNVENNFCESNRDYSDVVSICNKLSIPHTKINFIAEYWEEVFSEFIKGLKNYKTPNPDVLCNKFIKFKYFTKYAFDKGADYVATGHYCQITEVGNELCIKKAVDISKDQSYFLSHLSNKQLQRILFPLGSLCKTTVRKIARENNLINAEKKDSTGICFIGKRKFASFINNYIDNYPGNIVDYSNRKLGIHDGLSFYTIGQRKGLNIQRTPGPWFVYGKNISKNLLLVTDVKHRYLLLSDMCISNDVIWHTYKHKKIFCCKIKTRYRQHDQDVKVYKYKTHVCVYFINPILSVTPGQTIAFYLNDICIGGGTINKVFYKNRETVYY